MNVSISLTPELLSLIKEKVASGRYTSASEVVREALRLLERADRLESEQIEALRRAWREGIDSGDAGVLDFAELRETALREAASRLPDQD
ncbi:MAG: type II toxin-antitoxin system ParD family antitoxin [Stellaceae bacterium]